MTIAIIAPTYNEQDNIAQLISLILAQKAKLPAGDLLKIIVSDSHSTDSTKQIVQTIALTHQDTLHLGCFEQWFELFV